MRLYFKYLFFCIMGLLISCDNSEDSLSDTADTIDPVDPEEPVTYEQYGTPFNQMPATGDIVMYEVNLRALTSSGDLQGVISKLDHIKSLGVNTIWLMPIYPQGQLNSVGSPYAVRDYKAVSTEYGDLEDLRRLTDLAHARGMSVILDWVANHTSWDNPWIENRSWYTQNSSGQIVHPPGTNWQDVADLNYDNREMKDAMIDAMKYWIYEANVDGFRCDYADGVPFEFWQEVSTAMENIPNRELVLFAEGNRSDHFNAGFDLSFGWDFYSGVKNAFAGQPATSIFTAGTNEYVNVPDGKHFVRFTTNHDESAWDATPMVHFNGVQGALSASTITTFLEGVPLIYGSQEVGVSQTIPFFSNSVIDFNAHPQMLSTYQKMMQFYSRSSAARNGSNTSFAHNDVVVFKKELNGDEVLIIANIRNATINYSVPSQLDNSSWFNIMTQNTMTLPNQLSLAPYEFYILD